ncbi:hypothetical protein Tco_1074092 [Tanacetum coccineum]
MTKSSSTSLNLFLEETNTFDNSLTESKTFCFDLEENSSGSTTIANIEALKDNPTPSFDIVTKTSSTSLNLFLEETNTFDNSLPKSETFCFNLEEISSGSTTTRSDYSLPDYEVFYLNDDHIKEKSSGSTTTHADFSQYDSFIFDLSIDSFLPADRSDFYHEEFADELAHIISPPEYDCFCFKIEPELGEFTMDVGFVVVVVCGAHTRCRGGWDEERGSGVVVDCPDFEDSRVHGFVQCHTLDLHILSFHLENPIS